MSIKIKNIAGKHTPAKKTVEVKDVFVKELRFVDESGDITQEVTDALSPDVEKVSFKIVIELPDDESEE